MRLAFSLVLPCLVLASCGPNVALGTSIETRSPASLTEATTVVPLVIETAIIAPDPQAGMKSRQTITIDFGNRTVAQKFETGTTDFFGVSLSSARDRFIFKDVVFPRPGVTTFKVEGETASGVRVMPNINYEFAVEARSNGTVSVKGCHDGYPAYTVRYGGREIYSFRHQPRNLIELFGTCDIEVD